MADCWICTASSSLRYASNMRSGDVFFSCLSGAGGATTIYVLTLCTYRGSRFRTSWLRIRFVAYLADREPGVCACPCSPLHSRLGYRVYIYLTSLRLAASFHVIDSRSRDEPPGPLPSRHHNAVLRQAGSRSCDPGAEDLGVSDPGGAHSRGVCRSGGAASLQVPHLDVVRHRRTAEEPIKIRAARESSRGLFM